MNKSFRRFFWAFGLAAIVLALQIELGYFFNFRSNLILTFLISSSFFYEPIEILALALFGILVINWQPIVSLEILTILIFPILAFYLRRFFPWQSWLSNLILIFGGLIVFYFAANFSFHFLNDLKFQKELAAGLVLGGIVFAAFKELVS